MSEAADLPGLVLASASPRRRRLLASAGVRFRVESCDLDETPLEAEEPLAYVRRLALAKAEAVAARLGRAGDDSPVLAADTSVVLAQQLLGKPRDRGEAARMLQSLSGRAHQVITGTCLLAPGRAPLREEAITEVTFKRLRPEELDRYLATGEWRDKAGAYGIQGQAAFMVERISGSYTNVVGLPLCQVLEGLHRAGLQLLLPPGTETDA